MARPGRPATGGNGSARPPTVTGLREQHKRGRPRSTGDRRCGRCHQQVAKIRLRWPDGAICGRCFTEATHTYGTCPDCGEHRMLPGRSADGQPLCRDCAGITTALTCTRCHREAERFRTGLCIRCSLHDDLKEVLKPGDDLRLHRLIGLLTSSERPESIYTYMRGTKARALLEAIGERELPLTHDAFDQLPDSRAVDHLRALLTHHRMMPARGNETLVRFEQWLATRIADLPDDGTSQLIERYAAWQHLKRIRAKAADPDTNLETVIHAAKQDITQAGKFLIWLHNHHHIPAGEMRQHHIDDYLSDGPSTRKHIRNFVRWVNNQQGHPNGTLDVPFRNAQTTPMITQTERIQLVRNCLEHRNVIPATRVAGLILLLWAQPLNKIVMLRRDRLVTAPEGMRITLGTHAALVPEALTELFWKQLSNPGNQNTINAETPWLFPGRTAGQHLHSGTLSARLKVLGIDALRARNATLRDLSQELDARSLIDLLGYSPGIIAQHAARSGTPMSDYIPLKNQSP